jgi:tetratricopeptide (TPR) repeat protein
LSPAADLSDALSFLRIANDGTPYYETESVRLFPGVPAVRYRGAVHESVEEALVEAGIAIDRVPGLRIEHSPAQGPLHEKAARYAALAEAALRDEPADWLARRTWGLWLAGQGRAVEAESHLAHCIEEKPDDFTTLYGLAVLLSGTGRVSEAIDLLRRPGAATVPELRLALAKLYWVVGATGEALGLLEGLTESQPRAPGFWLCRSMLEHELGRNDLAIRSLRLASELLGRPKDCLVLEWACSPLSKDPAKAPA